MPVKFDLEGTFLTTEEAALALGLAKDSIRHYCTCTPPKLVGVKRGRDWFIPKAEIDRYKKERQTVGRPQSQKSA